MPGINSKSVLEYLESLRNEQDDLLNWIESFARENKIPILNWKAAELLEQIILIKKPKYVLEVGTAVAYSTIRMARLLDDGCVIDTIELSKHNLPIAKANIEKAKMGERINLIEGDAKKIIPSLGKTYDLIFLDADKKDYLDYYELLLPKLAVEGILFIDNLLWKGDINNQSENKNKPSVEIIKKLNEKISNDTRVKTTILPIGDGIGISIKK